MSEIAWLCLNYKEKFFLSGLKKIKVFLKSTVKTEPDDLAFGFLRSKKQGRVLGVPGGYFDGGNWVEGSFGACMVCSARVAVILTGQCTLAGHPTRNHHPLSHALCIR